VPGLSDNIQVYSIVGRFLEHSRIFFFRNGSANSLDGKLYFGSADWMRRNINDRVETTVPVLDPALKKRILDILMLQLNDHSQRWRLETDGTYTLLRDPNIVDAQGSQARIMQLTRERVI
jgi:polyphosphate kinase